MSMDEDINAALDAVAVGGTIYQLIRAGGRWPDSLPDMFRTLDGLSPSEKDQTIATLAVLLGKLYYAGKINARDLAEATS